MIVHALTGIVVTSLTSPPDAVNVGETLALTRETLDAIHAHLAVGAARGE
jgi:hypothetical protein